MEASNPFAQMPATPESIVAQVCKQLRDDYPEGLDARGNPLDARVESVVHDLWQGRVKTFVPVLALREAREQLRDEQTVIPASQPAARYRATRFSAEQPVQDSMRLDHDVMTLDSDEALRF
jgi:hypothetical protein